MNNSIVTPNPYTTFERIAAEESARRIIKFTKDGHWVAGADEDDLDGVEMLADMANLMVGWRKWVDGKIVDLDVGFVATGFVSKERDELNDANKDAWPKNAKGEATDPWQFGYYLQLSDEDGQTYTWAATSDGARQAIGDLSGEFSRKRTNPRVRLGAGWYKHRIYGRINTPKLEITGWSEPDAPVLPPTPPRKPMLSGTSGKPAPAADNAVGEDDDYAGPRADD